LNIHANTRIENELGFKEVMIPPVPSDCGLALGAAAYIEWINGSKIKNSSPFINQDSSVDIQAHKDIEIIREVNDVAKLIASNEIVAVYCGGGEAGPRALGHRSLLVRPDSIELKKKLSEGCKKREWYRPVAPIMLEEVAHQALIDLKKDSQLTKFMLGAWMVKEEWVPRFKGCIHSDGTVRAQVIKSADKESHHLFELLNNLKDHHKISGVINTSFNERGKPIVSSLDEAICQAISMGIKYLWIA
jgi:carbamoyltransferase